MGRKIMSFMRPSAFFRPKKSQKRPSGQNNLAAAKKSVFVLPHDDIVVHFSMKHNMGYFHELYLFFFLFKILLPPILIRFENVMDIHVFNYVMFHGEMHDNIIMRKDKKNCVAARPFWPEA